jgi:hypothetical protein
VESDISIWANGDFSIWRLHPRVRIKIRRKVGLDCDKLRQHLMHWQCLDRGV